MTKKEEEVVADSLASRSGSLVVDDNDDNDDKDDDQGDVAKGKKRKHHWAPLEVKEWMCELIEYKARSGWTRVQCVRHAQWLCSDVFEDVRRRQRSARLGTRWCRPKTLSALSLSLCDRRGPLAVRSWIARVPDEGDRIVNGSGPSLLVCCAKLNANTACMNSSCVFVTRTGLGSQLFASPSLLVCPCVSFVLCWW